MGLIPYGADDVQENSQIVITEGLSFRQAIRTKQFWILGVSYLCFGISLNALLVHFVPHVTDLGFTAATAATLLAVGNAIGIPGRLITGIFADRLGNKRMQIICLTLLTVALLWLIFARQLWMLYLCQIMRAFGSMGLLLLISPIIADLFGLISHGTIMGAITLIWTIGSAAGPTLAGYIFDTTSSYQLAFLISAIFNVVAVVLIIFIKPLHRGK